MEKVDKKRLEAFALVLSATVMGSFGPPIFMKFVSGINRDVGITYFLLLGGVSMIFIRTPVELKNTESFKKLFRPFVFLRLSLVGFLTALTFVFFVMAMQAGSITETSIIVRAGPLFVVFFSVIFLHEHVKNWPLVLLAAMLCIAGMLIFQGRNLSSIGKVRHIFILLALVTAMTQSLKTVIQGYVQKHDDISSEFNALAGMIIGSIFLFSYVLTSGGLFVVPTFIQFCLLLFLGLGTIAFPIWLSLKAYSFNVSMGKIAFMDYAIPFFTAFIAYFLNGERGFDYKNLVVGFLLMSVGVFIVSNNVQHSKKETDESEVLNEIPITIQTEED